jgi:hypothetical protein
MTEPLVIGIGSNKWAKDGSTKMISLMFPSNTTGTLSCHDDTGVNYIVPVGKKFVALLIQNSGHSNNYSTNGTSTSATYNLWKGTTADSTVGATNIWSNGSGLTRGVIGGQRISECSNMPSPYNEVYFEIAAGDYLTFVVLSSVGTGLMITGIETDV